MTEDRVDRSAALRLEDVTVRTADRVVLTVPDLTIAAGEIVAVMGPNGAGKSTLLHVAALLRRPESGGVWLAGQRVTRRNERALRRQTALVLQAPLLFDVSVLTNVVSGLRFRGVGGFEAERRVRPWLERFGIAHLAGRNARALSGGEAQRASLARAFATDPDLLLLDEPFAALDAPTRADLVPEVGRQLRDTNTAALIVTHDVAEARTLADRLLIVIDGHIVQAAPPAAAVANPASPAVARLLTPYGGVGGDGRE